MRPTRTNANLRHADLTRLVGVIRDPYQPGVVLPADMDPTEWIPLWEVQLRLWSNYTQASKWVRANIAADDKQMIGGRKYYRRSAVEAALAKEYRCPTCKRIYPRRRLTHRLPQNLLKAQATSKAPSTPS